MINKSAKFVKDLNLCLSDFKANYSKIAILCVGTDTIMGDAIGPIIGSKLKSLENRHIQVFGTVEDNLNFNNARDVINSIYNIFKEPYIITIDAALSNKRKVGDIVLNKGFIKIGKALNKSICFYSNININCVVGRNLDNGDNFEELKNVDKKSIGEMIEIISNGLENVLQSNLIQNIKAV